MPAGLRPVAVPTARTAAGRPTARAIWLYDAVRPAGNLANRLPDLALERRAREVDFDRVERADVAVEVGAQRVADGAGGDRELGCVVGAAVARVACPDVDETRLAQRAVGGLEVERAQRCVDPTVLGVHVRSLR